MASRLTSLAKNVLRERGIVVLECRLMLAMEAIIPRIESLKLEKVKATETVLEVLEGKWIVLLTRTEKGRCSQTLSTS